MPVGIDKPFAKILIVQIVDTFSPFNPIRQCRAGYIRRIVASFQTSYYPSRIGKHSTVCQEIIGKIHFF